MSINVGGDDITIKVYDPETKEVIATYDSYTKAARKLGVTFKVVYNACHSKTRRYSPFLKKEIAIRAVSNKKV
jgi:hypothetical protein